MIWLHFFIVMFFPSFQVFFSVNIGLRICLFLLNYPTIRCLGHDLVALLCSVVLVEVFPCDSFFWP